LLQEFKRKPTGSTLCPLPNIWGLCLWYEKRNKILQMHRGGRDRLKRFDFFQLRLISPTSAMMKSLSGSSFL
jgi:hypothetical protein